MSYPCLQKSVEGVIIGLQVQPRSSRNQIVGLQGDLLRVKLTSPPVDGAANKCCREFFAKLFQIGKTRIELITGDKSRQKRLLVRDVDLKQAEALLARYLDSPLDSN